VPELLSLRELDQFIFATNERLAKIESGVDLDEEPDEFTAFYHRNGGVEHPVLVQDVIELTEESKWSPLLEDGFEYVAYLWEEDTDSPIPVGENEEGDIFELSDTPDDLVVGDKVQINLREE